MRVSIYTCTTIPAPTPLFRYYLLITLVLRERDRTPVMVASGIIVQGNRIPANLRLYLSWHFLVPHIVVYSTNSSPFLGFIYLLQLLAFRRQERILHMTLIRPRPLTANTGTSVP